MIKRWARYHKLIHVYISNRLNCCPLHYRFVHKLTCQHCSICKSTIALVDPWIKSIRETLISQPIRLRLYYKRPTLDGAAVI